MLEQLVEPGFVIAVLGGVNAICAELVAIGVNNARRGLIHEPMDPRATPAVRVLHLVPAVYAHIVRLACDIASCEKCIELNFIKS